MHWYKKLRTDAKLRAKNKRNVMNWYNTCKIQEEIWNKWNKRMWDIHNEKKGHAHKWNTVDLRWIRNDTCRNKTTQILNEKDA
jgi:hypothetical protein